MSNEPITSRWRVLLRADAFLLAVAVVAGVAGAVLSGQFLDARAAAAAAEVRDRYDSAAAIVAATDLPAGEVLGPAHLAIRQIPRAFLPADAMPPERAGELIGTHTAIAMRRGTPVVSAALRSDGAVLRLASALTAGRRALTIAVDQVNSQAGNLQPGDWVDLYYSRTAGSEAVLVPLLQRVEVLATGSTLRGDPLRTPEEGGGFATLTLSLAATDALRVVLAQQSGSLSVVLRPPGDTSALEAGLRSSSELLRQRRALPAGIADSRVEVLVAGGGGLTPERAWLRVGDGQSRGEGT